MGCLICPHVVSALDLAEWGGERERERETIDRASRSKNARRVFLVFPIVPQCFFFFFWDVHSFFLEESLPPINWHFDVSQSRMLLGTKKNPAGVATSFPFPSPLSLVIFHFATLTHTHTHPQGRIRPQPRYHLQPNAARGK